MNIILYFFLFFLAFFTTILDVSFFSFLQVFQATILSSLALLISFSILGIRKSTIIYAAFLTLFFAIFSSLPVWLMISLFFGIPLIISAIRQRLAIDRSKLLLVLTFIFTTLLFQLSLALASLDFSASAFISVISFTVINTIFGLFIYYLCQKTLRLISRINRI